MAILSISQAARTAGVSRQTLHRKIRSGEVSKTTLPDGSPGVDTAELLRVFGSLPATPVTPRPSHEVTSATPIADSTLQLELSHARDRAQALEQQLGEARDREGKLLDLLASQSRLLEDKRAPAASVVPVPTGTRIELWLILLALVAAFGIAVALWLRP